jgi:hypothetical protein
MTTMADLLDYELPADKDGISYLPELKGEKGKAHDYVVYSSFMGPALVTKDGWKLRHFISKDIFQLYYLPNDYREEKNLICENPKIAEELKEILIRECDGDLNNGWFQIRRKIMPSIRK